MVAPKRVVAPKSQYEQWQDTIKTCRTDPSWNEYDETIKKTVDEYNRHLANTKGYLPLDWRLIKAMTWTESGARKQEWKTRPIQIGNHGDPGMQAVIDGKEGSSLVIPPSLRQRLSVYKIRNEPETNIQAGIGYLLTKCASYGETTTLDPADNKEYEYTVKQHDTLSKITHECHTTMTILNSMNHGLSTLHPNQKLKYKKGSIKQTITGWTRVTTNTIAVKYNGRKDPKYQAKLEYCLSMINGLQSTTPPCWKQVCH